MNVNSLEGTAQLVRRFATHHSFERAAAAQRDGNGQQSSDLTDEVSPRHASG
jgi:hypothetical protein